MAEPAQLLQYLLAVEIGHRDVEHDDADLGGAALELANGLEARATRADIET